MHIPDSQKKVKSSEEGRRTPSARPPRAGKAGRGHPAHAPEPSPSSRSSSRARRKSSRIRQQGQPGPVFPPVVALDVGTTKIACLVGEIDDAGRLARVRGIGNSPARGMHKGVVVDLKDAAASIAASAKEAAAAAAVEIGEVFVGVAGSHVTSMNRQVSLANPNPDHRVTRAEREALLERLKEVKVASDLQLIHALPRDYSLDGQDGIRRPVGMYATRIEMTGHLVFGAINSIQNLLAAVTEAGLRTADIVLEPLASSQACLLDQETESGVMLVDIGGGTTDVALFSHGRLVHTAVLPVGGNHITRDVSVGLKVPIDEAERIKIDYGHAQSHVVEDIEMARVDIPVPGRERPRRVTFSKKFLARIIEARVAEIFNLVLRQARESGYLSSAAAGIVITGGSSQLEGIATLAETVAKMPARVGRPNAAAGVDIPSNPVYATAVGLLLYGGKRIFLRGPSQPSEDSTTASGLWSEVLAKVKGWFGATNKT